MNTHLSIVTPVYQAVRYLDEFHSRMSKAAAAITPYYEIIYVNDGSKDGSVEKLLSIHQQDEHAIIVDLARNFGQPNAIRTGLAYARGDFVFVIDDDLEEQPEWLEQFYQAAHASDVDVVFSAQRNRKGKWFERYSGALFFFFLQRVLHAKAIRNVMTARLITKAHVATLVGLKERNASWTALSLWAGCRYTVLALDKVSQGLSSYNMRKRWRLMVNHVTSASLHPLHWPLMLAGLWIAGCMLFYLVGFFIPHMAFRQGETFLTVSGIWLILVCLTVLGIYLSQMFDEIRARPLAIVRTIYARGKGASQ